MTKDSQDEKTKPVRRRRFTGEFKAEAVRLWQVGASSAAEVAKELGVAASTLRSWISKAAKRRNGAPGSTQQEAPRELLAFEMGDTRGMELAPGTVARKWMDATGERFAYRCLPMLIANQAGWVIPCPVNFAATWSGGSRVSDVKLDFVGHGTDTRIASHFGSGIVTFVLPYLFRTPPGLALWVRGPANRPKDGAAPLEGIVETDWAAVTFTMNWKLTRPRARISFTKGEPVCMVSPVSLDLLEQLVPRRLPRSADADLAERYDAWFKSRVDFNAGLAQRRPDAVQRRWQKDYFLGKEADTAAGREHRTKLELKAFEAGADPPGRG